MFIPITNSPIPLVENKTIAYNDIVLPLKANGKDLKITSVLDINERNLEDCPGWSVETLYNLRKNQLEEEKRIENERKLKEMKKQKKLELTRKIFSFLKR